MKYLLDTHVAIWSLIGSDNITSEVKEIMKNKDNTFYYSVLSPWEIEIKHLKHKNFKLKGEEFSFLCDQAYCQCLEVKNKHVRELENIIKIDDKLKHNDPFDKMIMAQAKSENMTLITHDIKFKAYNLKNVIYL